MIRGTVSANREPVVRLRVRGPGGIVAVVGLVVDTGFTGALTLPAAVVAVLGLPWSKAHREVRWTSPLGRERVPI
jgi:predicted aspartyl protease